MFAPRLCITLLLVGLCGGASAEDAAPEVWILSGQSNACGKADTPGPEPMQRVEMFDYERKRWVTAREPLPMMNGKVGPFLRAGQRVARAGAPVRLVGYASGGKAIMHWDEHAQCWRYLKKNIHAGGRGATTFVWYQGESDALKRTTPALYQKMLTDLVNRVRAEAGNPTMLAVIVQIGGWKKKRGDFDAIREAQRNWVRTDAHAVLVPAVGRKLEDDVHLTKEGYYELGDAIGRAILRVRHDRNNGWPGPVLDAAAPAAAHADRVVAHFAEVKKLDHVERRDFTVVDAQGTLRCEKADADNARVILTFERALRLPAKLYYARGPNPRAKLTDEHGNHAPAAFVEIQEGPMPLDHFSAAPNGAGSPIDLDALPVEPGTPEALEPLLPPPTQPKPQTQTP